MLAVACGGSTPPPAAPSTATSAATGTGGPESAEPSNATTADPNEGWEKIRDEDGITVYRKEVEGSPLVAFRGEGIVDAPIGRIALIQMDLDHNPEWIEKMVESRLLNVYSDTEFLTYSHIGAPPLVSDRDFVNRIEIEYGAPDRIKFNMHSVVDPKGPNTDYVRAKLIHSSFELTSLGPNKTMMRCEIHADPMGSLPKWVVNLFQKGWAFKTITGMRKQSARTDIDLVSRAPMVRDLLIKKGYTP